MRELDFASSLFRNDVQSVEEKLSLLASIGSDSPEALTLEEIKGLCKALLLRLPVRPALRPGEARGA